MKNWLKYLFLICVLMLSFVTGCKSPPKLTAREVLNAGQEEKLYLAFNLRYFEQNKIFVENYLNGNVLCAGTEVDVLDYDSEKIVFKVLDAGGKVYTLHFNEQKVIMPVEKYMRIIFVKNNPMEKFDEETIRLIKDGKIEKAMSRDAVYVSLGMPSPLRTPDFWNNNTWIYFVEPGKFTRIVFKNEKVLEILE